MPGRGQLVLRRGHPATAAEWATRRLPQPAARLLFAGVQTAARFGPRIRRWAGRLGVRDPTTVTVLADGAGWIWRQAAVQPPGAVGVLDIFHALEHVAGCAHALFGEATAAAWDWSDHARRALLTKGASGIAIHLADTRRPLRSASKRRAVDGLANYFAERAASLGYAGRLASGRSIGRGLVEGACKQVIGRRLKQTGAWWTIRRANRMATLCCTRHGDAWDAYGKHVLS